MSEWIEINIGSIGEVITGHTPPTKNRAYYNGPYPFIKPTDMEKDERYVRSWEETYSDLAFQKYKKAYIPKGATGVVTIGTVGEKLFQTDRPCFTNQSVNVIIPYEEFDNDFVYYLLKFNLIQVSQANPGTASGRDHVSKTNFSSIVIRAPKDKNVQIKIGAILSSYDDFIEVNTKRIAILEQMAEQVYKEWFVRMRFPGYGSTKFEKGVPKGWEILSLGNLVEFKKGRNITKKTIVPGNIPVVAGGISPAYYHNKANTISPTITISASGANAGFVNIFHQDIWASDCSFLDSKGTDYIYYYYLQLKIRQTEVFLLQKGSAQPHVYPKDIMSLQTWKPTKELLGNFESIMIPIFEEIKTLNLQNKVLKQTRDFLLPRLMTGKLRVKNIEKSEVLKE